MSNSWTASCPGCVRRDQPWVLGPDDRLTTAGAALPVLDLRSSTVFLPLGGSGAFRTMSSLPGGALLLTRPLPQGAETWLLQP
jgi:hypothetical protein